MAPNGSTEFEGNTNLQTQPKKRINAAKYWCFTWNNYTEEDIQEIIGSTVPIKSYIFQREIGEKGTKHLQGIIELEKKGRPTSLKWDKKVHFEVCRDLEASKKYCSKTETREPGTQPYCKNWEIEEEYTAETIFKEDIKEFKEWQLEILEIIKQKPEKRKIYWYWETKGGAGKSTFAKYLSMKYGAIKMRGKSSDIFHGIAKTKELKGKYPEIVIIDIPRTSLEYVNYEAMEEVKNGHLFSGKYDSGEHIFRDPHVIVFANEPPNKKKMSGDRWIIKHIDETHGTSAVFAPPQASLGGSPRTLPELEME